MLSTSLHGDHTLCWAPCLASDLHAGMLLPRPRHLRGSLLGPAGFLQAWLGGGLREQVLACVGALLEELEQDQRCTILLTGKQLCPCPTPYCYHPCVSCVPQCFHNMYPSSQTFISAPAADAASLLL